MVHCIGEGGLDDENAVQFLHTLYSLFDEHRVLWSKIMSTFFKDIHDDPTIDIPRDLLICMQNPLMTRWWTIGKLSILYTTHHAVFDKFAQAVINITKTKKKKNVIASNYIRLKQSKWLLSDVFFISAFCSSWFNKHFNWYQQADPCIQKAGYLTFHRSTRFFVEWSDINAIEYGWSTNPLFAQYTTIYNTMTTEMKRQKDRQRKMFFDIVRRQIIKHDTRYIYGSNLIRSIYTELAIAKITIRIITNSVPLDSELITNYYSNVHKTIINLEELYLFYKQRITSKRITAIQSNLVFGLHHNNAHQILQNNINIWDLTNIYSNNIRKQAMMSFGAHPSTNHKNERLVKVAARTVVGGKQETAANYYFMAMNDFTNDDNDYKETNNQQTGKRKRNQKTPTTKLIELVTTVDNKLNLYAKAFLESTSTDEFNATKQWLQKTLKSKTNSIKICEETDNLKKMVAKRNEVITNSRTMFKGDFIPPLFNGYLDTNKFCSGKMVKTQYVQLEFYKRDMKSEYDNNKKKVNTLKKLLKDHEQKRFESEVTVELQNQGIDLEIQPTTLTSKLLILKETMNDNNVSDDMWNKYSVDINKYFKLQSSDFTFDDIVDLW